MDKHKLTWCIKHQDELTDAQLAAIGGRLSKSGSILGVNYRNAFPRYEGAQWVIREVNRTERRETRASLKRVAEDNDIDFDPRETCKRLPWMDRIH